MPNGDTHDPFGNAWELRRDHYGSQSIHSM